MSDKKDSVLYVQKGPATLTELSGAEVRDVFVQLRPASGAVPVDNGRAATLDDVASFFETFYVPNNAVLTVAGDVDEAPLLGPPPEPEFVPVERLVITGATVLSSFEQDAEGRWTAQILEDTSVLVEEGRIARFHGIMQEGGYTKPVENLLETGLPAATGKVLDETARIAALLRGL